MGTRGIGASIRKVVAAQLKPRKLPWQRKGLSRVEKIIGFLEFLPITKGKLTGKKLKLLPVQRQFIEDVYGAKGRVQIGVFSAPRGNGKTGLTAGLTLCHLLGPEAEFRGECYSAAIDRQQAALIADEMEAIILHTPEFADVVNMTKWPHRKIEVIKAGHPGIGSRYRALSADAGRAYGLAPSFWCYDEMAQAKNRELFDALQTAMGKRKRSLGVIISTQAASDDAPLSEIIDLGLRKIDPAIVVRLLAAPKDADPFDHDVIAAVNPAFGKFLDADDVFSEADRARAMPSFESAFRNFRLNQRIAVDGEKQFLTPEVWERSAGAVDHSLFTDGRPVYGGLDLSGRIDLTALVLACDDDAGNTHLWPIAWTPSATIADRTQRDRVPYDAWIRQGLIEATPGPAIDLDFVAERIAAITAGMNLMMINFDEWNINNLLAAFNRIGFMPPLEGFRQGMKSFAPAVTAFEVKAVEGRFRHGGHPVLRWCIGNTTMEKDAAGNRKPDKARDYGRIDLAVAAIMAVRAMQEPAEIFDARAIVG